MPVMPAMRLLWEMVTPLGMPVDPLVYMMTAMSEGNGGTRARAAGRITQDSTNTDIPGWNANAGEMFKNSDQHVWRREIFRRFQTKERKKRDRM